MIRQANQYDQDEVIRLLKQYQQASPIESHKQSNESTALRILAQIWAGRGVIFVNEQHGIVNGMLVAMINPNFWDHSIVCLNELAYWVDPDARNTSIGYRLLKEYQQYAEELKSQGKINYYTISKMVTSPDLSYDKFGFSKLEEMWRA